TRRGGESPCPARASGGADGGQGARLPAGARPARRDDDAGGGTGRHGHGHSPVRAPAGVVVPRRPAGGLAAPRRAGPGGPGARGGRRDWEDAGMTTVPFTKGHGTQNDFVLVPDLDGTRPLSTDEV